ncbi:MAG TPA: tRNA (adenosine(37)-N6)-threonylcarbamoyltransferase complex dimerization subunit type 1 TsaB [Dokdonella sp.]|uniref:tRNA (adenosine(37)-N6)-threonylcarbamoyltransferase complex dimerization subunit type 1 TsaB n=1 Tax=Dokdonella sp. TaxID=2291710 RepID=UPI002D7F19A7|nr:tRNA (adenosine(37)-N6)-threonylcarbamoyltransferase complex dimerization subunit type 1 TsaB [Dokdonella sp.]HET9033448.1 tRNA (adenosine(37)-N6)-threonylcarbamoyltransferase complex dimerization subunit type 1 TsaB [Dokdonella sp.]
MNLLAIETSTESCSVALSCNGELISRSEFAPRRHAELLLPMCEEVLTEAGVSRRQLDVIAVGRGPGAFTGVRLAISAAQGIALALDLPVIPISSLAALALDAPNNNHPILAVIDARMGEIYAGTFRRDQEGLVEPLGMESVGSAAVLKVAAGQIWNVIGSGWDSYAEMIQSRLESAPAWAQGERYPQATAIARLAAREASSGQGLAPELALPVYLRDKVALTTKERQQVRN